MGWGALGEIRWRQKLRSKYVQSQPALEFSPRSFAPAREEHIPSARAWRHTFHIGHLFLPCKYSSPAFLDFRQLAQFLLPWLMWAGFAGASPTQVNHRKAHGFVSHWCVGLSLLWPPESHWIERKEEVKCNKCPEFFLSAVIEKVQCATALFCQPPATMHLQMRQFSAGRSKSMKPPHVSSLFALGMVQILGGPDGGSRPRTPQRSQSRDGASAQLRIRADVESLQHTCVILEAPARHRSTSHQNESKLGAVPQSCFSLQHPKLTSR